VERRAFAMTPPEAAPSLPGWLPDRLAPTANPHYDVMVRVADQHLNAVPLGIVSKRYCLVQHAELLEGVVAGLKAAKLPWETLETEVRITKLGGRLHFTVHLPQTFRVLVGRDMLDLTIECLNSVDRSRAFRVGMGWIRQVCGNGLFVGRVTASMRRPHVETLRLKDVPGLVTKGFKAAALDSAQWQKRAAMKVSAGALRVWTDTIVAKKWGVLAAARTFHITRTGYDGCLAVVSETGAASRRTMLRTDQVPGSELPNDNMFRVGQVLAWVANSPTEWGARLERRQQVPELLEPLIRLANAESRQPAC
jgi:hypothetical protein